MAFPILLQCIEMTTTKLYDENENNRAPFNIFFYLFALSKLENVAVKIFP